SLAVTDSNWITLWRRVAADDPVGLVGSPRFISLAFLAVLLIASLVVDARRRCGGFDAPLNAASKVAALLLLLLGTLGVIDALGWALVGWWWWHVQFRWLIDTLLLAALPCGLGLCFG